MAMNLSDDHLDCFGEVVSEDLLNEKKNRVCVWLFMIWPI